MKLEIPNNVLCVAAVKYASQEQIESIIKEGFTTLGWSTVQQFQKLRPLLPYDCHHHFIGHLQKNKVSALLSSDIDLIHSVDSIDLAKKIDTSAEARKRTQPILLQVKTDVTKEYGFSFEELEKIFPEMMNLKNIQIKGLMTIPPLTKNSEKKRAIYRKTRKCRDHLEKKFHISLPYLSMGMSDDYEIAIEEGATIIRLGRILFETQKIKND